MHSVLLYRRNIPVISSREQNHLPRSPILEWPVGHASVEGADFSPHLPRRPPFQRTQGHSSVEGDFAFDDPKLAKQQFHPRETALSALGSGLEQLLHRRFTILSEKIVHK